jgi:hypothetical protein
MDNVILEKWRNLIQACKNYYVDSLPTGMADSEYDLLEMRAMAEDNFSVRDYVFDTYLKGTKTKNSYIEKIKKAKVEEGEMLQAIKNFQANYGKKIYCDLKYDGSSLAIYLDPTTGTPIRVVTVGNLNIDNYGVDQTWKLLKFLPAKFPKGIVAIQAEALIDTTRLGNNPETARQRANGLINSKYCEDDVLNLLTIRAYRYYTDDTEYGKNIRMTDYRTNLKNFQTIKSPLDGHIMFAPAQTWTVGELESMPGFTETDHTITDTGKFLNDGYVLYSEDGICLGALKYSGAGSETETSTTVREIIWNDQSSKGKDSWSANVRIDPITIKGSVIRKPSAGSVSKLIKNNITPEAKVTIILANSTIPMVGSVINPGNGDFNWPTCSCGYKLSNKDIFGSLLKCGNPMCSNRFNRMCEYLNYFPTTEELISKLDLNRLLVIDRFKWENTDVSIEKLISYVKENNEVEFSKYLSSYMKTTLQLATLSLVLQPAWSALTAFCQVR